MASLQLTNKEWYFLHVQMKIILKKQPDNHMAKAMLHKLIDNRPNLDDFNSEFKMEYESNWT